MKSLIILVLAVVATQAAVVSDDFSIEYHYPDAAEIEASETPETRALARNNINVGSTAGASVVRRVQVSRNGIANQRVGIDVTARGVNGVRIRAVQAVQLSALGASARIISGGIGQTFVTVRIQSALSRGYNYQLTFWGR